jgi:ATP synthase I subunit
MSGLSDIAPGPMARYLDGAYPRIVKLAVALTVIGAIASIPLRDWHSTLVLAAGSIIGTLNLVWLHRGTNLMVSRMLAAHPERPSKWRVALFFPLRYILVIGAVYAILKSYQGVLVSFIVGLASPVMALIGESIYEAVVLSKTDRA